MTTTIHPTAIVDKKAEIGAGVEIGPWAFVGPHCSVGAGSKLAMRVTLESHVRLGENVTVGIGSVLGGLPQDLKFKGEESRLVTVRQFASMPPSTGGRPSPSRRRLASTRFSCRTCISPTTVRSATM